MTSIMAGMDLMLWRHAEAHAAREGQADLDRSLTSKGERQARRMADWLNVRLPDSTRILVSPARRCQQTAEALNRPFRTVADLAPDLGVDALLKAARWPQAEQPVLVVGHQPTLGLAAATLLTGMPLPWSVKKGAVWWLRLRDRDDDLDAAGSPPTHPPARQLVLQAVQVPDLL
jgi:phosphohistidine phosphatase